MENAVAEHIGSVFIINSYFNRLNANKTKVFYIFYNHITFIALYLDD